MIFIGRIRSDRFRGHRVRGFQFYIAKILDEFFVDFVKIHVFLCFFSHVVGLSLPSFINFTPQGTMEKRGQTLIKLLESWERDRVPWKTEG